MFYIMFINMIIFIIFFIYIEPLLFKQKLSKNAEYGSARFSNKTEIRKNFCQEKIDDIKEAGFPIYYSKHLNHIYFDRETPHYVYLGSTGSGKSVTAVIPTCIFIANAKKKRSVLITDPKGEIFSSTSNMFLQNGYDIITIDLRNPEKSNRINLLQPIIEEYKKYIEYESKAAQESSDKKMKMQYNNISMAALAETNRIISSLSEMIMQDKVEQKDPFWNNSAKNLLEGLISFFLEEYKNGNIKENQITLTSIRKFQNSSMNSLNMKKFKNYLEKKEYGLKSKDTLIGVLSSAENTYKSITAVFASKMSIFDDINVSNILSSSDFTFDILGIKPVAFYIIVPDEDKTYYMLITLIVGMMYKELVKLSNFNENKRLAVEIDFILDEFANCPPLADIDTIVSVARSRGMHFHFFIQSFSQLENVYGKNVAQIILDNCGLMYLKTNTQETAEEISKRLGRKTIESNSIRQSTSFINSNGDKSTNLIGRELMTADEIKQLHYKTIIFPTIGFPIIRDTIIYTKFKNYISGEISRNTNFIKDLKDNLFTVEMLETNNLSKDNQCNELDSLYQEMKIQDKKNLEEVQKQIQLILNNDFTTELITNENQRISLKIKLERKLTKREKILLRKRVNIDKFHTNIIENTCDDVIEIFPLNP